MIRRIAITIGDNDFYQTFEPWMRVLAEQIPCLHANAVTKEWLTNVFIASAPGFYWLCQNHLGYRLDWNPEQYFKDHLTVLINEEVDAYLEKYNNDCNHALHIVEFRPNLEPYHWIV